MTSAMTVMVSVKNVSKAVGEKKPRRRLWEKLSFDVSSGELVSVTGPSGCGKSTLLNCLGLLDRPDNGDIDIKGIPLASASARQRMRMRRESVGYLFQDYALIDNDTVRQNIALGSRARGRQLTEDIAQALAEVGLEGYENHRVYQLSGGEQQRVAIARLSVRKPEVILADEPTASLDRSNAASVLTHLRTLSDHGAAVIVVSHDPWVIAQTDRTIELGENS
ncbi:ABC transporter ATP-binding protein [Corynebacterium sp. 320]|nr:ABC transporter ATP-binding protein [Corynebacterium sp. 320]KAB3528008.1 ABC transporter ATP-binding protein [Corynebacterium sp. 250]QNP91549.1 ABC transporter ATP-binding protein [Corynebacterium zhongnanshanii]